MADQSEQSRIVKALSGWAIKGTEAICSAPLQCDGLRVSYGSASAGEVSFGWTEPLCVGEH